MASLIETPSENPTTMRRKRTYEEGEGNSDESAKRAKLGGIWANLDLILSLQSKDIALERKIELAFNFITSEENNCNTGSHEPISLPRLASFLCNWIQPILISSEKTKQSSDELFDPCLDQRTWTILKFCVEKKPSISTSPNLLKPITRIARHTLTQFETESLFERFSECVYSIITSNSRAFYKAGVDLWINCAIEVTNLSHKFLLKENQTLLRFSILFLGHFSAFLRFCSNPKIFRVFVDRLLNPVLEFLVFLHSQENKETQIEKVQILLKVFEGILSNALFHPSHINGFLNLKNSREIKGSYHQNLFQFRGTNSENKAVIKAGFGYLFRLLLDRTKLKTQNKPKIGEVFEEESKESKKSLFEVFEHFIQPLLTEFKNFKFSDLGEIKLVEIHCMLKSVNQTLNCFIEEKIYSPTEDTEEQSHFNFLKRIYDAIISISEEIFKFWGTNLHCEGENVKKILPLIGREVFISVGKFLEIEYKTLGDEIVNVWLMIFAFLDVNLSLEDSKHKFLFNEEILNIGSKLINVFCELRQVNYPIFALFQAIRAHGDSFKSMEITELPFSIGNLHLAPQNLLNSQTTLLGSSSFRLSISNSIKSMPERQAGRFIEELKSEFSKTQKWIPDSNLDFDLKSEILGRVFSELYMTLLDSLTITSSNSLLVANSIENLMKEIRPIFRLLVENRPEKKNKNGNENENENIFISSLVGGSGIPFRLSISWSMVFFFRVYASSRSLYRQLISLMAPDQARKYSELFGDLFATKFGTDWLNNDNDNNNGYFYWISNPSISLLDLIESLSENLFGVDNSGRFSLNFALILMVFQRVNDLKRQIKAFKFLKTEEENNSGKDKKRVKKLKRIIIDLENEASGLCNFMTENLNLIEKNQIELNLNRDDDLGFCSLDEKSFCIKIWVLLCKNIDIWTPFASEEGLRKFFSCLVIYALPLEESENFRKHPLRRVSSELLSDISLYDEPVLLKNLILRFCDFLEKSLTNIMNYLGVKVDLESSPDWLDHKWVSGSNLLSNRKAKKNEEYSVSSFSEDLRNCEGLLGFLCKIPAVNFNPEISLRIINYIFHLERVVIFNIAASEKSDTFAIKPLRFVKIFLSCRRALRYIITSSDDSKLLSNIFFDPESSFGWLSVSLKKLIRNNSCKNAKEIKFYIADHTSHIISKLSRVFSALPFHKKNELIEPYENIEIMAQTIQNQIGTIPINKKGDFVNYFGSVSCFQGFLWGLVSSLDKIPITNLSEINWYWSRLEGYIRNYETFVDVFFSLLLSEGDDKESIINGFVNFGEIMSKWDEKQKQEEITDLPLKVQVIKSLLKGENLETAFIVRELFISYAAIFKLKCILSPQINDNNDANIMHKIAISNVILNEMANNSYYLDDFSFAWLEGILVFLEIIGGHLNKSEFNISKEIYSQLINSHLGAIGKCISLEGKRAKLSIHDTSRSFESIQESDNNNNIDNNNNNNNNNNGVLSGFKSRVRTSLKKLINEGAKSRIRSFVQIIERALVGLDNNKDSNLVYNLNTGNFEGQSANVSSFVAAGVDSFYLALDSLSGKEHVLKKNMPSLISCIFNIISHLESPSIFYISKIPLDKTQFNDPDPGAVVLMCVEVLTAIIARYSCPMSACHVAQCLTLPDSLFKSFCGIIKEGELNGFVLDKEFLCDLYSACCKLLWTTLKHRIREVGPCLALLEESTTTLLTCLESNNDNNNLSNSKSCFAWDMQMATKCATFFRRIYEEIRQQKDVLAIKSYYFLSTYINIYSGYGPSQTGIKREIDETLRPGVYALIDICTQSDLQLLHTVIGEGPRRSTLSALLHDYKIHFQYEGKI